MTAVAVVLAALGVALITLGLWMAWPPAAPVVAGLALVHLGRALLAETPDSVEDAE